MRELARRELLGEFSDSKEESGPREERELAEVRARGRANA